MAGDSDGWAQELMNRRGRGTRETYNKCRHMKEPAKAAEERVHQSPSSAPEDFWAKEKEQRTGMAGMRGATEAEGSSNNISEASEVARTTARNPLANKGTLVCEDWNSNGYNNDLEQGIDGMSRLSGSSMEAMGSFVLSPEEEYIMESEIIRLRQESFVVKVVGSRPNRPLLHDWLQSCLQ